MRHGAHRDGSACAAKASSRARQQTPISARIRRLTGNATKQLNARERTWIASKTPKWSARGLEQDVAVSLESLQTSYVDLYFLHQQKALPSLPLMD